MVHLITPVCPHVSSRRVGLSAAFFPSSSLLQPDRIVDAECLRARIDDDKIRGFSAVHG